MCIKYLLKFGEKTHIEAFSKGVLYCSNAETFWGIEEKQKLRGQGDILEAGSKFFANKMQIQSHDTGCSSFINGRSDLLIRYEPAKYIPVFCMFSVNEADCELDENGHWAINLSAHKQNVIRKHFPKADAVAIIRDPELFLDNVSKSIGHEIKHGIVHYFQIDDGIKSENGGSPAIDMDYLMYLTQDIPPIIDQKKRTTQYFFGSDFAFRALFCKDVFFKDEQEYRIVLPNERITKGTSYTFFHNEKIDVVPIGELIGC